MWELPSSFVALIFSLKHLSLSSSRRHASFLQQRAEWCSCPKWQAFPTYLSWRIYSLSKKAKWEIRDMIQIDLGGKLKVRRNYVCVLCICVLQPWNAALAKEAFTSLLAFLLLPNSKQNIMTIKNISQLWLLFSGWPSCSAQPLLFSFQALHPWMNGSKPLKGKKGHSLSEHPKFNTWDKNHGWPLTISSRV